MIHEDGIEVYLKPAGKCNEKHMRYPELELDTEDTDDGRSKRAFIPFVDEEFEIVVRFTDEFEMYSATAVHISTGYGDLKPLSSDDRCFPDIFENPLWASSVLRHRVLDSYRAQGQTTILSSSLKTIKMPRYQESMDFDTDERWNFRLTRNTYKQAVNPGSLTVFVQRGHVEWEDMNNPYDQKRLMGATDPIEPRPSKDGSFVQLHSPNGRKYRFDFRPRSHRRLVEVDKMIRSRSGQRDLSDTEANDIARYRPIQNEEFDKWQQLTRKNLLSCSRFYKECHSNAAITVDAAGNVFRSVEDRPNDHKSVPADDDLTQSTEQSGLAKPGNAGSSKNGANQGPRFELLGPTKGPREYIHDPDERRDRNGQPRKPVKPPEESLLVKLPTAQRANREDLKGQQDLGRRPNDIRALEKRPGGPRKQKLPKICDCPVQHRSTPKRLAASSAEQSAVEQQVPTKTQKGPINNGVMTFGQLEEQLAEKPQVAEQPPAETAVKSCTRCHKIRKPRRGRKVAWREKTGGWMYVPQNAPDEDGPAGDEDDDEPLLTKLETAEVASCAQEDTTRSEAESHPQHGTVALAAVTASAGPEITASAETTQSQEQPNEASLSESTAPVKPTSESEAANNVAHPCRPEKTRIEVDLTNGADDQNVPVKPAQSVTPERNISYGEDIEYQLRQLSREERRLEIEEKEDELKHKRKKLRRVKQSGALVKAENNVKVEIDLTD